MFITPACAEEHHDEGRGHGGDRPLVGSQAAGGWRPAAGVDSCAELAQRRAANLAATFGELDAARNTVRRVPTESEVQRWIDEAKTMPRAVEH